MFERREVLARGSCRGGRGRGLFRKRRELTDQRCDQDDAYRSGNCHDGKADDVVFSEYFVHRRIAQEGG